eukprot:7376613-Prymnesium_polylepis.2
MSPGDGWAYLELKRQSCWGRIGKAAPASPCDGRLRSKASSSSGAASACGGDSEGEWASLAMEESKST